MTINEFINETSTLENFFEKPLNEEQQKIWFEKFKSFKVEDYRQIVLKAKTTFKYMPKLSEMLDIPLQREPETTHEYEYKKCSHCLGSGLIKYIDKDKYEHFALCSCENVKNIPEGVRSRLYTAEELGIGG